MAKKKIKPHQKQSELDKVFSSVEQLLAYSAKHPYQDGYKLTEKNGGYQMVWQERGVAFETLHFKTKKEVKAFLEDLRKKKP